MDWIVGGIALAVGIVLNILVILSSFLVWDEIKQPGDEPGHLFFIGISLFIVLAVTNGWCCLNTAARLSK